MVTDIDGKGYGTEAGSVHAFFQWCERIKFFIIKFQFKLVSKKHNKKTGDSYLSPVFVLA